MWTTGAQNVLFDIKGVQKKELAIQAIDSVGLWEHYQLMHSKY